MTEPGGPARGGVAGPGGGAVAGAPERPPFTALAEVYDAIMQDVPYDDWCDFVLRQATLRGWRGRRLLDVGCGTGNATRPMCDRGFEVVAVDASAAMAARARAKCPDAEVVVADVRDLALGERVDLAFATFDALNTLLDDADLLAALAAVRRALAPGGLFLFDANTTEGLTSLWEDGVAEGWADGVHYRWTHAWHADLGLATVEAYCRTAHGAFVERHVERPLDPEPLRRLLAGAGFVEVEILAYPGGGPAPADAPRIWAVARAPGPAGG